MLKKIQKIKTFFKKDLTFKKRYDIIHRSQRSGCGAAGSALPWGGRGRKFKSCHSDQKRGCVRFDGLPRFSLFYKGFKQKKEDEKSSSFFVVF